MCSGGVDDALVQLIGDAVHGDAGQLAGEDGEAVVAHDRAGERPVATGDHERKFDSDCLPRGVDRRRVISPVVTSGRSAIVSVASPDAAMASRSGAESA